MADDRALHHGIHIQVARDLVQRLRLALVSHHRGPRDHTQRADFAQIRDQRIGHAVGEILLLRIAGKVHQRKHSQGMNRLSSDAPVMHPPPAARQRQENGCCRAEREEQRLARAARGV